MNATQIQNQLPVDIDPDIIITGEFKGDGCAIGAADGAVRRHGEVNGGLHAEVVVGRLRACAHIEGEEAGAVSVTGRVMPRVVSDEDGAVLEFVPGELSVTVFIREMDIRAGMICTVVGAEGIIAVSGGIDKGDLNVIINLFVSLVLGEKSRFGYVEGDFPVGQGRGCRANCLCGKFEDDG